MTTDEPFAEATVTFGIPFLSERVARDWPAAQRLLANTLRSVFNQNDAAVRVIIACHEKPQIDEINDPRVTVIQAEFDIPRFRWEMEMDRMRKLELLGQAFRAQGGGWLFTLDADDLVANDLATRVRSASTKAIVIANGYRLDARRSKAQPLRRFWRKCGSCIAVNWAPEELPLVALADDPPIFHQFAETPHYLLTGLFDAQGWSYVFLNDPLVAYLINHGQNESDVLVRMTWRWQLYFRLTPWRPWTTEMDRRFGTDAAARRAAVYSGSGLFSVEAPEPSPN